ncbi:exodeoxyribonuclease V subunit alpha [Chlamydia trachomatis]|nr:exodeoxyribonuclease V subunit alpha [Chlamydia trachomatis]
MNVNQHVQDIVPSLLTQHILLPFDIAFAQKHLSQEEFSQEAEAFLATASALLRCGYPYFSICDETIHPTLPGISNKQLFQWFQLLSSRIKEERNRFGQDNAPVSVSFSQRHRDHPLQVFCKIAILVAFSALWVTPMQ